MRRWPSVGRPVARCVSGSRLGRAVRPLGKLELDRPGESVVRLEWLLGKSRLLQGIGFIAWVENMAEHGGVSGIKGGDGAASAAAKTDKWRPVCNNRWLSRMAVR